MLLGEVAWLSEKYKSRCLLKRPKAFDIMLLRDDSDHKIRRPGQKARKWSLRGRNRISTVGVVVNVVVVGRKTLPWNDGYDSAVAGDFIYHRLGHLQSDRMVL